jgi:Arc/MetJ family transcription regulator
VNYRKTTIELDVDALREAGRNLGTSGLKETVNAALLDVNRRAALARAAEHVRAGRLRVPDEAAWARRRNART